MLTPRGEMSTIPTTLAPSTPHTPPTVGILSISVYLEIMKQNEPPFWKKVELKSTVSSTISDVCDYFWKKMRLCFSHVEFCCSPSERIFHKMSKEDQEVPFSLIFGYVIKSRRPIEGFFIFRCCYFTGYDSKVFPIRIFYDLDKCLSLKLYSDAKVWFILYAFHTLTNMKFYGGYQRVFLSLDRDAREISLSDDKTTLESFVQQNNLPESNNSLLTLYFF